MFVLDQLVPHGVGEDGLRRWTITLPDYSYDGKVLTSADWNAVQVLDTLKSVGARTSYEVLAGRLYSPVRLGA